MHELAQGNAVWNRRMEQYRNVHDPSCERYSQLMDRDKEGWLQQATQLIRRMCLAKQPAYRDGAWKGYFDNDVRDVRELFDEHTKAKVRGVASNTSRS